MFSNTILVRCPYNLSDNALWKTLLNIFNMSFNDFKNDGM